MNFILQVKTLNKCSMLVVKEKQKQKRKIQITEKIPLSPLSADNHWYCLDEYCSIFFMCSHIFITHMHECIYHIIFILQKLNYNIVWFSSFYLTIYTSCYFICPDIYLLGNDIDNIIHNIPQKAASLI